MQLTFLGTGTSQGVPMIGCRCDVCQSKDARDQRLRSAVLVESETTTVVIDTGPDFRQQMLRIGSSKLDAVVFTHEHKDHLAGLDDVRAYNYLSKKAMQVYCTSAVESALRREYNYVFENPHYPGVPQLELHGVNENPFVIGDLTFLPLPVMHASMPVMGYRIGDLSYVTDANFIAESTLELMRGSRIVILNALRHEKHPSHFTLDEALHVIEQLGNPQTYLTHISHQLGKHEDLEKHLPPHVSLAYDGLTLE